MTRRTYQLDGEPQGQAANPPAPTPPIENQPPGDLAGYPSIDALVQGYRNSSQEAQRLSQRLQQVEQAMVQMQQPRTQSPRPEDRLSDLGIPVDALDEVINARLQKAFEPIAKGVNARSQVMAQYPDYVKFENDVNQYIQADPQLAQTYGAMFNADPVGAIEYAVLKFGESKRRSGAQNGDAGNRQEKVNAQIPTGRTSETRARQDAGTADITAKAWEHFQKTGDPKPFAKARLRQGIPDSFFER
jgi:hypothetical protein